MKKVTFGTPEPIVPTGFCPHLRYEETEIGYDLTRIGFKTTARGCVLEFPLAGEEQVYGFGLQLQGFNHKGHKLVLRTNSDPVANTGDSHAPVPFFVTTKGYGVYVDTARYVEAYCGFVKQSSAVGAARRDIITDADALYVKEQNGATSLLTVEIPVAKGVDIYLFEGDTITDVVAAYNRFSGGGCNPPAWGLGVLYRACAKYTGEQVTALADAFRDKEIPCDVIGLEPGWHSAAYPCTYTWNPALYPDPQKVVDHLRARGFHINLWEHAFVHPDAPIYEPLKAYSGDYTVWGGLVPDFSTAEARDIFAAHHRDRLVAMGIDGFKLDECDSSDYVHDWSFPACAAFPGGMDGEQYHQMFGTLYMQTVLQALGDTPTLSQVRQAGALAAGYPFVLYSDLYDHRDFIRGVVNSGFSGLLWTPELRDARSKKDLLRRLQTTVFSAQCLINAWYCETPPWEEWDCEAEVKYWLQVRQALVPILQEAFAVYRDTGRPPVRALVADYTDDPETYCIDDQYLFCDRLLVAPLTAESDTRRVYLPRGTWRDYWTGAAVPCGWQEVTADTIPVYERTE